MTNKLHLLNFTVNSFAKIDKSAPVVIVWDDKNRIVELQGDQGVGKSSVLSAFLAASGFKMPENATNKTDNGRSVSFEFEKEGKRYKVKITNSQFYVEMLVGDAWAKMGTPKTVLDSVLGPVGQSPMFLKEYDGKKQIEWIRDFYRLNEEEINLEKELDKKIKEFYDGRRESKKNSERLQNELNSNTYYINRTDWQQKIKAFEETVTDENSIKKIQTDHEQYVKNNNGLDAFKENKKTYEQDKQDLEDDIKKLEEQLQLKRQELTNKESAIVTVSERIAAGEKWLDENKAALDNYNNITEVIKSQTEMTTHKVNFNAMLAKEKDYNFQSDEFVRNQGGLDNSKEAKRKFIEAITPKIDGFEVCIPDGEDEKREGIFYKGLSPIEMSESELVTFYLALLKAMDINIIVMENLTSLGSGAIEMLNYFAENGGYVLASVMNRAEKNLKVIIQDKIVD